MSLVRVVWLGSRSWRIRLRCAYLQSIIPEAPLRRSTVCHVPPPELRRFERTRRKLYRDTSFEERDHVPRRRPFDLQEAVNFACDGVGLAGLAEEYGTPLYVYSAEQIVYRYELFEAAFGT